VAAVHWVVRGGNIAAQGRHKGTKSVGMVALIRSQQKQTDAGFNPKSGERKILKIIEPRDTCI